MPKRSWSKMMGCHPTAHFIAGIVPEEDVMAVSPRQLFGLISKLLTRLKLTALYAVTIDRQGRTPEIHCVFERELDAAKLAKALHAHVASRYPGWASQRT